MAGREVAVIFPRMLLNETSKWDPRSGSQTLSLKHGQKYFDGYPGPRSELRVIPGCPGPRGRSIRPQLLSATEQGGAELEGDREAEERPGGLKCPHPRSAATGTLAGASDCSLALLTLFHTPSVYKRREGLCG